MGKQDKSSVGNALISNRFSKRRHKRKQASSFLHTSELEDGTDWGRLNLQSVTEQSTLNDFLATAELADREFTAERRNITIVTENKDDLMSDETMEMIKKMQDQHQDLLTIPRRPPWTKSMTKESLDKLERHMFLEWRRQLVELQEKKGLEMTPFEKQLDFWRQLWRVVERSDVIVQIVDARNPLLFRSNDLANYVKEVSPHKTNVLLINKADYLTPKQREMWASYFTKENIRVAFWSATKEKEKQDQREALERQKAFVEQVQKHELLDLVNSDDSSDTSSEDNISDEENGDTAEISGTDKDDAAELSVSGKEEMSDMTSEEKVTSLQENVSPEVVDGGDSNDNWEDVDDSDDDWEDVDESASSEDEDDIYNKEKCEICGKIILTVNGARECDCSEQQNTTDNGDYCVAMLKRLQIERKKQPLQNEAPVKNNPNMLGVEELLEFFKQIHVGDTVKSNITTVGMVGYPNVGKSSTINSILQTKKVPVSATPGRTKHFQTLFVDKTLMLCDCPGLVMPSFISTKAHMVLNGVLPIDQLRDYVAPVALLCRLIPREILEAMYGIILPAPSGNDDPNRPPTAHELMTAFGLTKGYTTHKGVADYRKASRLILKDFVTGKLLYCEPPPDFDVDGFRPTPKLEDLPKVVKISQAHKEKHEKQVEIENSSFMQKHVQGVHSKGVSGYAFKGYSTGRGDIPTKFNEFGEEIKHKPWREALKSKRNKHVKLRKVYAHYDNY